MKSSTASKQEEWKRLDQIKIQNLKELEQIQKQIKSANTQRENDIGENEDEFEDYFEGEMLKDMESFQGFEEKIDYFEALRKVEDNVKLLPAEKDES